MFGPSFRIEITDLCFGLRGTCLVVLQREEGYEHFVTISAISGVVAKGDMNSDVDSHKRTQKTYQQKN